MAVALLGCRPDGQAAQAAHLVSRNVVQHEVRGVGARVAARAVAPRGVRAPARPAAVARVLVLAVRVARADDPVEARREPRAAAVPGDGGISL